MESFNPPVQVFQTFLNGSGLVQVVVNNRLTPGYFSGRRQFLGWKTGAFLVSTSNCLEKCRTGDFSPARRRDLALSPSAPPVVRSLYQKR